MCCGDRPYVIVVKRGEAIANVFIVDDLSELSSDPRFEEVMFMDISCPKDLGLSMVDVHDKRFRKFACIIATLVTTLSKGNVPH